jgi:CHAT domain-containing protein
MDQRAAVRRVIPGMPDRRYRAGFLGGVALGLFLAALALTSPAVLAQEGIQEAPPDAAALPDAAQSMTDDEARKALAAPVPADATPRQRIDLLLRQRAAARIVGDQAALIRALEQLTETAKGDPDWARYMLDLINAEFTFGSPKRSIEYGEKLLAVADLDPVLRSSTAASLTWKYCDANDARNCERVFALAQRAYSALPAGMDAGARAAATTSYLQAKAIVLRVRGDLDGQVDTLREATVTARNYLQRALATAGGDTQAARYRGAVAMADYTAGQLIYALLRQGRSAEALAIGQDGLARARLAGLGPDSLGGWHHRMAATLITQRRFDEALVNARASATELRRAGGQSSGQQYALARNAEIVALIGLERWAEADATYIAFMDEIRADKVSYDRSYDSRLAALLAAKNNRADVALPLMDANYRYRLRLYGPKHPFTVETRGVRGAIQLINNAPGAAMMDYDDFFTVLLDSGSSWVDLAPVGPRGLYLNIVLTEFLRYAARQYQAGGQDAIERKVFERLVQITDRLGTGVTQRSILQSSAKIRTGDPGLADLLAREQEQRDRLREAYGQILSTLQATDAKDTPDERRRTLRDQLKKQRDEAESAQKKLEEIRREQNSRFPEFAALVSPVNPGLDTLQKALVEGEAFVGIYPTREGTFAWAVNANGKRALHVSRWTEADIARRVEAMRGMLDAGERLPNLPPLDLASALELYNELLLPLRPALAGAAVLNISAAGSLGALPLATLVTAPGKDPRTAAWLVREFAVVQTPGAAAFVALRSRESAQLPAKMFMGFGDPLFNVAASAVPTESTSATRGAGAARKLVGAGRARNAATYTVESGFRYADIPPLPETRDELIALAETLGADPKADLVLGASATRKAVLTAPLADRRVVAFATHGLLPGEIPGLSKPALAMAATNNPADSPLLTLDDVLSLKLNARWVVLSACNTAGGERDGAAMSGLVRGFFFAGARSVLATHWAVESEASRQLVSRIFAEYAQDPRANRAQSLRRAQLAMIDGTLGGGNYAHPFFWAPYALFGDPAR